MRNGRLPHDHCENIYKIMFGVLAQTQIIVFEKMRRESEVYLMHQVFVPYAVLPNNRWVCQKTVMLL